MFQQLSSRQYALNLIYLGSLTVFLFVFAAFLGFTGARSIFYDFWVSFLVLLISGVLGLLAFYNLKTLTKLVEVRITENNIILEQFAKKERFPFELIKNVSYRYFPLLYGEAIIKITFKEKTAFGNHVCFMPTRLDKNKKFKLDRNIKSILEEKITKPNMRYS